VLASDYWRASGLKKLVSVLGQRIFLAPLPSHLRYIHKLRILSKFDNFANIDMIRSRLRRGFDCASPQVMALTRTCLLIPKPNIPIKNPEWTCRLDRVIRSA
jgi:hypothetical protein